MRDRLPDIRAIPSQERAVEIAVELEPHTEDAESPAAMEYRWDPDTEILSARLPGVGAGVAEAETGSMEVAGRDGSWLILDVRADRLRGIEVAVWPTVRRRAALAPPEARERATAHILPAPRARGALAGLSTAVVAESDETERVLHFRLGAGRPARTVRLGGDFLLDVDERSRLAGLWLLNVPPFPLHP